MQAIRCSEKNEDQLPPCLKYRKAKRIRYNLKKLKPVFSANLDPGPVLFRSNNKKSSVNRSVEIPAAIRAHDGSP